jgi:phosphate transport system permease protein
MATINRTVLARVKRFDRLARWIITAGGLLVIASVIAIVALIVGVTMPLFSPARSERISAMAMPVELSGRLPVALGVDLVELSRQAGSNSVTFYAILVTGEVVFFDLSPGSDGAGDLTRSRVLGRGRAEHPGGSAGQTVEAVERTTGSLYTLRWSDGAVSMIDVDVAAQFDDMGRRSVRCEVKPRASLPAEAGEKPLQSLMRPGRGDSFTCVQLMPGNKLVVVRQIAVENELTGEVANDLKRLTIAEQIPGPVSAMTMNADGSTLFVGTSDGNLARWEFKDDLKVAFHENIRGFLDDREITALSMVFGDVSLAVGDATGAVTIWFEIRPADAERRLRLIRELTGHAGAVRDIVPSRRDKTLLSLGEDGVAGLDYMTSGRRLLELAADSRLVRVGFSPRGNAVIGCDADGHLNVWQLHSPHSDISLGALFGKVHYEGYERPEWKWQSSGDEPKHSVVPVIFGTFKSTFYAMLFAIPLALFAAVYVSHFTTPAFKRTIKPIIEIMAALPSVVIGFLILLWAGPLLANWLVAVFASFVTIPLMFFAFMMIWQALRRADWAKRVENGYEFIVLVPVVCLGAALAVWIAPWLESLLFAGNFQQWLFTTTGDQYEPLNAIVVAMGLGFAVIPIIFSISEDSLSSIPHSLTAASLALGASRWQTVWRVILPSASPGIFAAIMIGFGRAVGETMIVFMAAGNTPLMDFSPFNGFRTLSANIAVEMPEAPMGGSLYRILFLCAVILFLMTFLLNTVAELVRQQLRKRYGRY